MRKRAEKQAAKLRGMRKRRPEPAPKQNLELWPHKVEGGKLVRQLQKHVQALREQPSHGNRGLFLDDVFIVYLLAFYNPSLRTLRTLEDFSQTQQAQKHLTLERICKSTLSDFHKTVDPEQIAPIVAALRGALERQAGGPQLPQDLTGLLDRVLAVDGTFFAAAADVAWALAHRNQCATRHRARLDVTLDVSAWLPEVISVPDPGEGEAHSAARRVIPGAVHLYDRGFGSFELLAAHYEPQGEELAPKAQFVLRAKSNQLNFVATEERTLSTAAQAARIVSDRVGYLAGSQGNRAPAIVVREVVIENADGERVRLLTNLLDVQAEVIGLLYRYRWQIELFFRWLKCYARFDHLISHSKQGVTLNFYVVIIGVLLMYLHTGARPSKYAMILLGLVASGGESFETILPILRERERQCERDRQSAARRRARKKAEGR